MVEGVPNRAVDLWDATERVGILDLVGRGVVVGHQPRVAQEVAHLRGDGDLAGVRAGELVGGRVGDVRPEQRLDRLRRRDRGRAREPVRVGQQERADPAHQLRPVEEGEALLRLEDERVEPLFAQREQGRHDVAAQLHLAAPDQGQREVGERREVARRADTSLGGHDRVDPELEEPQQPVNDHGPAARVTERQRVRPQEEHRPHDVARQRGTHPHGVAHEEVLLEPPRVGRRDVRRRQVAEPGRDPVHDLARGHEPLDDGAGLLHPGPGIPVEDGASATPGHRLDVRDRQVGARQDDGRRPGGR